MQIRLFKRIKTLEADIRQLMRIAEINAAETDILRKRANEAGLVDFDMKAYVESGDFIKKGNRKIRRKGIKRGKK